MTDWSAFISLVAVLCSLLFGYIGFQRGLKKDGAHDGESNADLRYIRGRVDDVLLEQKDTNRSINQLTERVVRVEESAKQAHKRMDDHCRSEGKGE